MFGNFMMKSSIGVPSTKHDLDQSKPWFFLSKNTKATDYGSGGEVFSHPGMGNVEDRTWRILDGSDDSVKITKDQLMSWIAKEMIRGANGIAIWIQGWTNSKTFIQKARDICDKFNVKMVGFVESYAGSVGSRVGLPIGIGNFDECVTFFDKAFDAIVIWKFIDKWNSFLDTRNDWMHTSGGCSYTKTIGVSQAAYNINYIDGTGIGGNINEKTSPPKSKYWQEVAQWAKDKSAPFCLIYPDNSSSQSDAPEDVIGVFNGTRYHEYVVDDDEDD